ncbi:hypothetical protein ACFTQ7_04195 [Lysinibacillus sp. NPDC056959]|uniref:hypothetical protein n=1 Tax=Lysinibacillus sp. NPDC056959 TaxID=3345981 RepID=UPI0036310FF4
MNKWGFLLIFAICLGVTAFKIVPLYQDEIVSAKITPRRTTFIKYSLVKRT